MKRSMKYAAIASTVLGVMLGFAAPANASSATPANSGTTTDACPGGGARASAGFTSSSRQLFASDDCSDGFGVRVYYRLNGGAQVQFNNTGGVGSLKTKVVAPAGSHGTIEYILCTTRSDGGARACALPVDDSY